MVVGLELMNFNLSIQSFCYFLEYLFLYSPVRPDYNFFFAFLDKIHLNCTYFEDRHAKAAITVINKYLVNDEVNGVC